MENYMYVESENMDLHGKEVGTYNVILHKEQYILYMYV